MLRLAAGYACLFVGFVLGAELGRSLSISPTFATFWPPAGIYLAALLLAGRRRDPLTVAVAVAANLATNYWLFDRPLGVNFGFCFANTAQALTAVAVLRRFGISTETTPLRFVSVLACTAGLVAPAVGATVGAAVLAWGYHRPFDASWTLWATSNALGMLLFVPPVVVVFQPGLRTKCRGVPPWRVVEFCTVLSLLAVSCYHIFGVLDRPLPLVILPSLLWVALRFDVRGVPFSNLIFATTAVFFAQRGRGIFSDCSTLVEQMVCSQGALSVISLSFLAMAGLVAERRRTAEILAESELRFRLLVQETVDYAICMLDVEGRVTTWNVGAARMTGWDESEILGGDAARFYGGGASAEESLREALSAARETGRHADEGWRFHKAGAPFWASAVLTAVYDGPSGDEISKNGRPEKVGRELRGYSLIMRDRTEPRLREIELETTRTLLEETTLKFRNLAHTDPLTQLCNRRGFFDEFDAELARSTRHAVPFSLLLLDVDHFKSFNDTYGHSAGDEVLKEVARLLAAGVRGTDVVGRYGGEEFVVLLPATDAEGAIGVAERLRVSIACAPWLRRPITVSVGAATLDLVADNGLRLIEEADKSLYASKAAGRNRSMHFMETAGRELAIM
jgi:diguanylate cyclase (GGDEF)-like protein/PAS domain S-box-containing protein